MEVGKRMDARRGALTGAIIDAWLEEDDESKVKKK
jgi:hypothetical protein